jgi:hypothetical protein
MFLRVNGTAQSYGTGQDALEDEISVRALRAHTGKLPVFDIRAITRAVEELHGVGDDSRGSIVPAANRAALDGDLAQLREKRAIPMPCDRTVDHRGDGGHDHGDLATGQKAKPHLSFGQIEFPRFTLDLLPTLLPSSHRSPETQALGSPRRAWYASAMRLTTAIRLDAHPTGRNNPRALGLEPLSLVVCILRSFSG